MRREPFDPKRPLVAARGFIFAGVAFQKGDPFPTKGFSPRLIRRQYEAMAVNHAADSDADDGPIAMTGPRGGRYTITAPWLETPLIIRGKVNAQRALADLREEGPPLGFIEGGSEVEIAGGEGGWYEISAPWLDQPEKVQGREAAEARQREIHDAGDPEAGESNDPLPDDAEGNPANAESENSGSDADGGEGGPEGAGSDATAAAPPDGGEAGGSDGKPATA